MALSTSWVQAVAEKNTARHVDDVIWRKAGSSSHQTLGPQVSALPHFILKSHRSVPDSKRTTFQTAPCSTWRCSRPALQGLGAGAHSRLCSFQCATWHSRLRQAGKQEHQKN